MLNSEGQKQDLASLSRLAIVIGTSCLTDPEGETRYPVDYVQTSALVRIAAALEQQTDVLRGREVGFDRETLEDGMNHFHLKHEKGLRVFNIQVLASSPEKAHEWVGLLGQFAQDLVAAANAGRSMRFTAKVPVFQDHYQAFSAGLVEFNAFYAQPDPGRVFLAGLQDDSAILRYADPSALFQLGEYWQDNKQRLLKKKGGPADA